MKFEDFALFDDCAGHPDEYHLQFLALLLTKDGRKILRERTFIPLRIIRTYTLATIPDTPLPQTKFVKFGHQG